MKKKAALDVQLVQFPTLQPVSERRKVERKLCTLRHKIMIARKAISISAFTSSLRCIKCPLNESVSPTSCFAFSLKQFETVSWLQGLIIGKLRC